MLKLMKHLIEKQQTKEDVHIVFIHAIKVFMTEEERDVYLLALWYFFNEKVQYCSETSTILFKLATNITVKYTDTFQFTAIFNSLKELRIIIRSFEAMMDKVAEHPEDIELQQALLEQFTIFAKIFLNEYPKDVEEHYKFAQKLIKGYPNLI
jgi:hypothetical protein